MYYVSSISHGVKSYDGTGVTACAYLLTGESVNYS